MAWFSPDGLSLCIVTGYSARLWDARTGQSRTGPLGGGERFASDAESCAFSPDSLRVVTESRFNGLQVWDASTGRPETQIPARDAATFSPDGRRLVAASSDGTARIWDAHSGEPLTGAMGHGGRVRVAAFSSNGERLLTASLDGSARVWDAHSGKPLTERLAHAGGVWKTSFSPDYERIRTSTFRETLIWDVPAAGAGDSISMAALTEAVAGVRLNDRGALVPASARISVLDRLRRESAAAPAGDHTFLGFVRWFLADPWERLVSPFATLTLPDFIRGRLAEEGDAALDELRREFPDHPALAQAATGSGR